MTNNLHKYKTLIWYANFMIWGQYKRDKRYSTFVVMQLFNTAAYAGIFVVTNTNIIFKLNNGIFWYLTILLIMNISFAMFERIADSNISIQSSLIEKYHMGFGDWLLLRFYYTRISISELLNMVLIFSVLLSKVELLYATMFTLAYFVFLHGLCSIYAYAFMSFKMKNILNICLLLFYILFVTVIFIWRQEIGKNINIFRLNTLLSLIFAVIVTKIVLLLIYKNKKKINKWNIKENTNTSKKIPVTTKILLGNKPVKPLKVLLIKECILLFKCKIHLLVQPFAYVVVMLSIFKENYLHLLIAFFIVDFGFHYGGNYLGLEDYAFIYTLQAPLFDKKLLFRCKNLMLLIILLLGTVINMAVMFVFVKPGLNEVLQMIVVAFFAVSIMLLVGSVLSIYLFNTSYSKKNNIIKNLLPMTGIVIVISLFPSIAFTNKTFTLAFIAFTVVCFISSIYFSIINPSISVDLLNKRKEKILYAIRNI